MGVRYAPLSAKNAPPQHNPPSPAPPQHNPPNNAPPQHGGGGGGKGGGGGMPGKKY